jgi:catalase-peroxidase
MTFTIPRILTGSALAALALIGCQSDVREAEPAAVQAPSANAPDAPADADSKKVWWPEQVDLSPLRRAAHDPHGELDYAEAFERLDLDVVKADIANVLTDSKEWWPADYGTYGPFFIRLAWHSAGTYRATDGRGGADGGQIRFEPLNSWPDNANLDKARRLLWPVKAKYGASLSWADLMVLTGNVSLEEMGFDTLGFAGGRIDDWRADGVDWGPEKTMLEAERYHGERELDDPLAAVRMGLIYVNPEGPNSNHDPVSAAHDIRTTFGRMAMDDAETVALIAGGHTFGKAHGAHAPADCVGPEPAAAGLAYQGLGWDNRCGAGNGPDAVTSGLEGAWTSAPAQWSTQYLSNLFTYEWKMAKSPAGATQWIPTASAAASLVPDAHDPDKRHAPIMFTTDLSLRQDPAYAKIAKRYQENPEEFERAFAEAWFKLTHRDLGPRSRYLGPEVPDEVFDWQDPLPEPVHPPLTAAQQDRLKEAVLATDLTVAELVRVAWASASTYRNTDMRGGANGARIRLAPQKDWPANDPATLARVLTTLEQVRADTGIGVSMADLIVLAGAAAIEEASGTSVPFQPGRVDATAEQTDVTSFGFLEPRADAFRNHYTDEAYGRATDAMIDKAATLGLTVPEVTALIGGLRVLGANAGGATHGVFTDTPGMLTNDFFVNLLDMETRWEPVGDGTFVGKGPDGATRFTATEVDLVFGSNSELRAVSEVYAYDAERFQEDFVAAWTKVMTADRFDLGR